MVECLKSKQKHSHCLLKAVLLCYSAGLCCAASDSIDRIEQRQLSNETNVIAIEQSIERSITDEAVGFDSYPTWWIVVSIIIWILHATVVLCGIFFLATLVSKPTIRNVSYNIYLVFLVFSDVIINAAQTWYPLIWVTVFYLCISFWINVLVATKIYQLMVKSCKRMKISPSSIKAVYIKCLCVYILAILFASWSSCNYSWSPLSLKSNLIQFQSPNNGIFSVAATWIIMIIIWVIPSGYVLCIRLDIWRSKLLPPSGQTRRMLSLYFFRIIVILFGCNIPILIFLQVISSLSAPSSSNTGGCSGVQFVLFAVIRLLIIFQAGVNLALAYQKRDIGIAMQQSITHTRRFAASLWDKIKCYETVSMDTPRPPIINKWDVSTARRISSFGFTVEKEVWDFFEHVDEDHPRCTKDSADESGLKTGEVTIASGNMDKISISRGIECTESLPQVVMEGQNDSSFIVPRELLTDYASEEGSSTSAPESVASIESPDSDFRILNDGFKRLDDECDQISKIFSEY